MSPPRSAFSGQPLGGTTGERLARLPDIVAELRRISRESVPAEELEKPARWVW